MWIHVPTTFLPSAQESGALSSGSESPDQVLAQSVWSRGKPTQPRFWRRVWKTGRFTRLRYGATLPPSTLSRGVESWIASLRATRASPTATPERSAAPTTPDGFSTTFSGSSRACGLRVYSARTSRGTPTDRSATSRRHWSEWVTALRQEYSQRKRYVSITDENDFSSWPTAAAQKGSSEATMYRADGKSRGDILSYAAELFWPTPTAGTPNSARGSGQDPQARRDQGHAVNLKDVADHWPTPRASEAGPDFAKAGRSDTGMALPATAEMWGTPTATVRVRDDETMAKGLESRRTQGRSSVPLYLGEQADRWSTPRATDGQKGSPHQAFGDGGGVPLAAEAIRWATPRAEISRALGNAKHIEGRGNGNLEDQSATWETPTAAVTDGSRKTRGGERSGELLLSGQAEAKTEMWRTPTSLSSGDSNMPGNSRNQNVSEGLASRLPLPARLTRDGPAYSKARRYVVRLYLTLSSPRLPSWKRLRAWWVRCQRRKLSEWFVEWLHGWPIGWTDSERGVTGFRPWLRRSRGELSKLVSVSPIDRPLF